MSYNIQVIFGIALIIACHAGHGKSKDQPTANTEITSLDLQDASVWSDDFASEDLVGVTGWSSSVLLDGSRDAGHPTYHGPFTSPGSTTLHRYFNIESYSQVSISLDFIWSCEPQPLTDYFSVTLGASTSSEWSFGYPDDDPSIELISDTAITNRCPQNDAKAWRKSITYSAITAPNPEYFVEITSHSTSEEHALITNIQMQLEPLCDLSAFNPTAEIIAHYAQSVDIGDECKNSLRNEEHEAIISALEDKYQIYITKTRDTDSIYEGNYFGIAPLTPQDVASDVLQIASEDREIIADILDTELTNILPSSDTESTEEELSVVCPQLNSIYTNIALLQRRMMMGIDPTNNEDGAVFIERDNFCSYTNRIGTDESNDGIFAIEIGDSHVQIPYDMINTGREEWRAEKMDSVDISVMCVDNVLLNDCNGMMHDGEGDQLALSIDIAVDSTAANVPFTLTFPYSEENSHRVCAWVENEDQEEWEYDGCDTTVTEDAIICQCNHRTVFSLIEDLRLNRDAATNAKSLHVSGVYIGFLVVYSLLALAATYLVITLYRIKDMKSLAFVIVSVITAQIYCHVIQYIYLSFAELQRIPLGVTYCVISLPLLCHFWVCSLLILHWMKIFECAKTFTANNRTLDIAIVWMNVLISVVFIALLVASMSVEEETLPIIISASNGVLGSVCILICTAWFYFGWKTSTILIKSADAVKDSCAGALSEALTLRRRLLRLTFVIGFCFFTQSIVAILSIIEHLQLFGDNFVNFATIWAICDVVIFVTFILFYRLYVLRQKQVYMMEQKARELEREARRSRRDITFTNGAHHKAKPSLAADSSLQAFRNNNVPRKSVTAFKPSIIDEGRQSPNDIHVPLPLMRNNSSQLGVISPFEAPTIANMKLRSKRSGSRISIVSNSTMCTASVTTLKSANSLDSNASAWSNTLGRSGRSRSRDDSSIQGRRQLKIRNKDLLDLDYNDRQRSHSASCSSRQKSNASTPSASRETSITPKKAKKGGKTIKPKRKMKRVQSDRLMVKKKGKRKGSHPQNHTMDKMRLTSDSVVRTKKKKKNKVVKSASRPDHSKNKGKKKKTKAPKSKTPKAESKPKPRTKKKSSSKKVVTKSKTNGKLKSKPKEKDYDNHELDDQIEIALHEEHKRSSSSRSSVASLKGFHYILKNKTSQSASKAMGKKGKKRKNPLKSKLSNSKSKKSEIKPKPKIKASRSNSKTAKIQSKKSAKKVSAKTMNKKRKHKEKADK